MKPPVSFREFAVTLAREAGGIIQKNFALAMEKEWKEDGSPITATDRAINRLVLDAVKKQFPGHGFMGEEGSDYQEMDEYIWVGDPVDGTVCFGHGIPIATFALALTRLGKVILSVVYDPFMDRLFYAEKGKGTLLNDRPIRVSTHGNLNRTVISVEGEYYKNLWHLPRLLREAGAKPIKLYSSIYAAALVASGEFAGAIIGSTHPWDAAPVKGIVEGAGGKVTDLNGNDQRYDRETKGYIASNGLIHDDLLAMIPAP